MNSKLQAVTSMLIVLMALPAAAEDGSPLAAAQARYGIGMSLLTGGDPAASLPYFRSCETELQGQWQYHLHYGVALMTASSQAIMIAGRKEAIVRSSFERMRYLRDAMGHFQLAEQGAPSPELKAVCIASQGKLLSWVGSPVDAIEQYRRATELSLEYAPVLMQVVKTVADPCSTGLTSAKAEK